MAVSLVSTGVTFPDNSTQTTAATGFGFKNRIINGAMVIDQRNAGASVTVTSAGGGFAVDRFPTFNQCDGGVTAQQISDAPSGFNNSLRVTITSADSNLGTIQYVDVRQNIEGFNVADLAWGTAAAQTVSLSFWVKSSLTGTFGGSFMNSSLNRAYPFSYTIASANTWEFKTITVPGDTTGTWEKTNGNGMFVILNLGAGSDFQGAANAWVASRKHTANGAVSLVATNGATWQVTGVQLEKGSTATSFDYRPYGTELALCQRYCIVYGGQSLYERFGLGLNASTTEAYPYIPFPVEMRSIPTLTYSSLSHFTLWNGSILGAPTAITADSASGGGGNKYATFSCSKTGLTANAVIGLIANNTTSARLTFSSEL